MRSLLYADFGTIQTAELPIPTPAPDEVLLRVTACGICGSELEAFKHRSARRPPPLVMGHEFCGAVEAVGSAVRGFVPGDRVVSNSLSGCRNCSRCRRGDEHLCAQRRLYGMHRPGAFAEFVAAPERDLLVWPAALPAEAACLAEPLANGVHMVRLTQDLRPRLVLVIGAGPIGLLAQQAFQAMTGAQVIVCDVNPERLEIASRLGAARTVQPLAEDLLAAIRTATAGEGVDVVIDAVGANITKSQSLAAVRPGGAVVWIGLAQDAINLSSFALTLPEIRLHGTYGARLTELREALDLLAGGKIDTQSWVPSAPLRQGEALFRQMLAAQGGDVKGVLLP